MKKSRWQVVSTSRYNRCPTRGNQLSADGKSLPSRLHGCSVRHGQTWPCISWGIFFKGSDGLALKSSDRPLPRRVIRPKRETKGNNAENHPVLPAFLDHSPASPGHGHRVSSSASVAVISSPFPRALFQLLLQIPFLPPPSVASCE